MMLNPLLFLDISGGEFLIILLGIFLIFGPKKMPEMARKIGRAMNELKKASNDITKEFRDETSAISREISTARESVRREAEALRKSIPDIATLAPDDVSIYPDPKPSEDKTVVKPPEIIEAQPEENSNQTT